MFSPTELLWFSVMYYFSFFFSWKKIFFKHFKMGLERMDKPFKKSSKASQTCFHICSHNFNGLNRYLSILRRKIFPFINISCHKMFTTGIFIWGHDCIYWRALFRVDLVKAMVFPVVIYGCESWNIKKAERLRIDAFELWCWRRLLRVPWTARRSNQSNLKEISHGIFQARVLEWGAIAFSST